MGGNRSDVHVGALDGLRGLSVLGVVAFHLASLDGGDRRGLLGGGWLGVDVFFTLSGYLITSLLLLEVSRDGGIDLRAFWRRRIRRLQPAALVAVTAIAGTALWWAPAGTAASVRGQAVAALTGMANWQSLWSNRPYAAGVSPSGFEHFWSLAVEEQFYLVWPLVVAGLAVSVRRRWVRRPNRAILGLAVGGTAASWLVLNLTSLQRGYVGTDARTGSILLGAALACVVPLDRRAASERARRLAGILAGMGLGVTALLWVVAGWPPRLDLGLVVPLQGLATTAVLAGLLLAPGSRPGRALAWGPLALVGKVSYGLYLWHWPVFVLLTPHRLGQGWVVTTTVRLTVVIGLTALSWFLVERPVRVGVLLPSTRLAFPVAVGLVLIVAATASRAIDPPPAWAQADGTLSVRQAARPAVTTVPGAPARPQRVLIVGDSIPTSLIAEASQSFQMSNGRLLQLLAAEGISGATATISGCPVTEELIQVEGDVRGGCLFVQQARLPAAMDAFRPDLVVWYSRQDVYPSLQEDGSYRVDQRALRTRYAERVRWFAERGAKVLFVSPGPNADGYDQSAPLGSSKKSMTLLDRHLDAVARENPQEVVGVVHMSDLLCGGSRTSCPDVAPDGTRFRPQDGVHFTAPGNDVASKWLAEQIAGVDLSGAAPKVP